MELVRTRILCQIISPQLATSPCILYRSIFIGLSKNGLLTTNFALDNLPSIGHVTLYFVPFDHYRTLKKRTAKRLHSYRFRSIFIGLSKNGLLTFTQPSGTKATFSCTRVSCSSMWAVWSRISSGSLSNRIFSGCQAHRVRSGLWKNFEGSRHQC